jgi:hypothetical protein
LEQDENGNARLIIPSCTLDDDGLYRIVASNSVGSAHDKCTATVKKAPKQAEEAPQINGVFDAGKAPRVVIPLESIRVPEGQGFKLRCKFEGAKPMSIQWYKGIFDFSNANLYNSCLDGERIYSYSRCAITENPDGSCELVVDSSARGDAGGYRCVATNDYGSARTTGEVTVQLKDRQKRNLDDELKKGKAPGFTIPLTDKRPKLGEVATFECLPYGSPFPTIKWMKASF